MGITSLSNFVIIVIVISSQKIISHSVILYHKIQHFVDKNEATYYKKNHTPDLAIRAWETNIESLILMSIQYEVLFSYAFLKAISDMVYLHMFNFICFPVLPA